MYHRPMIESALADSMDRLGPMGGPIEGPLLVAISGGIDSTVLLHALVRLSHGRNFRCIAAHINHGLRADASREDERAVQEFAGALEIDCRVVQVDVAPERASQPSRSRPTVQEAARRLRYEALRKLASEEGALHIATAHHLNDQAETVFMRMLRGCGPDGLAGIPERSPDGVIVRPLLGVTRDQIHAYAAASRLRWCEDASNADLRYTRNRLRAEFLPRLTEAFNPQLAQRVAELAEAQRRDSEWIETLVNDAAPSWIVRRSDADALELTKSGWNGLPEALARRLVLRALREMGAGRDLTRTHLMRVLCFLRAETGARGGAVIELPGGLRLTRKRHCYLLNRTNTLG